MFEGGSQCWREAANDGGKESMLEGGPTMVQSPRSHNYRRLPELRW